MIYSLPPVESGLSVTATGTAWLFGSYVMVANNTGVDIAIHGITFETTNILGADTTQSILFEIATGQKGSEVTKIQIPYNIRNDTAVGFYPGKFVLCYLPEPVLIQRGTRLSIRVTDSLTGSTSYEGVKMRYSATAPLVNGAYPNDYQFVKVGDGMWTSEKIK